MACELRTNSARAARLPRITRQLPTKSARVRRKLRGSTIQASIKIPRARQKENPRFREGLPFLRASSFRLPIRAFAHRLRRLSTFLPTLHFLRATKRLRLSRQISALAGVEQRLRLRCLASFHFPFSIRLSADRSSVP